MLFSIGVWDERTGVGEEEVRLLFRRALPRRGEREDGRRGVLLSDAPLDEAHLLGLLDAGGERPS